MTPLATESRLSDPDVAYRALIDAHRGLTDEESAALNTRLVLILANQVGDLEILRQAAEFATAGAGRTVMHCPKLRTCARESFPHASVKTRNGPLIKVQATEDRGGVPDGIDDFHSPPLPGARGRRRRRARAVCAKATRRRRR